MKKKNDIWNCYSDKCVKRETNKVEELNILEPDDCIDFSVEDNIVYLERDEDLVFYNFLQQMVDDNLIPNNSSMSMWYLVDGDGKQSLNFMGWTLGINPQLNDDGHPEIDYFISII